MKFVVEFTTTTTWRATIEAADRAALDELFANNDDDLLFADAVEVDGSTAEVVAVTAISVPPN